MPCGCCCWPRGVSSFPLPNAPRRRPARCVWGGWEAGRLGGGQGRARPADLSIWMCDLQFRALQSEMSFSLIGAEMAVAVGLRWWVMLAGTVHAHQGQRLRGLMVDVIGLSGAHNKMEVLMLWSRLAKAVGGRHPRHTRPPTDGPCPALCYSLFQPGNMVAPAKQHRKSRK